MHLSGTDSERKYKVHPRLSSDNEISHKYKSGYTQDLHITTESHETLTDKIYSSEYLDLNDLGKLTLWKITCGLTFSHLEDFIY